MIDVAGQAICAIEEGDFESVKARLASLLKKIISRPSEFEAVWHPLGFMHIKLNENQRKALRLHIWLKDSPKIDLPTSLMHNHNWNLMSYVLCGSIINHTLEVDYETSTPTHKIYEVFYIDQVNMLYPTNSIVTYKTVNSSYYESGNKYTIGAGDFHYTELGNSDDLTSTIVVADTVTTGPPKSLGPIASVSHRMERFRASAYEIEKAAKSILSSIGS